MEKVKESTKENSKILWEETILGEPASKSNSRRIIRIGKQPRIIKSKKALDYLTSMQHQLSNLCKDMDLIEGDLSIYFDVWYCTRRPDLDIELIKDGMQGWVYKNDRQVREQHAKWHKDSDHPRCLIRVLMYEDEEKILNL